MSVFDLNGPTFLGLYVVLFFVALLWSVRRRQRVLDKFSLNGAEETRLTDPYEIAYLAGGAPRCVQVLVVKLIQCGAVKWERTRILRKSRLVAVGQLEAGFNEIERTLFISLLNYGKKGMALDDVYRLVSTKFTGIESRLAKLGLRPTASEASGRSRIIALPMLALMVFGIVKVVVGISRDKPVLFLIFLIVITFIAAAIVAAHNKKLTPAGEVLLGRMRAGKVRPSDMGSLNASLCGIALLDISAAATDPLLAGLDSALTGEISRIGQQSGSSGCGGSGCSGGSSGCSSGGGGCGGCGGGGD
jgi:uncharacterized protein (TIGR04222 family)